MKVIDLLDYDPSDSVHTLPSEVSIKLSEISKVIFKSKKSTLLTGAGISCNAGIPDFRSGDGLYNLVKEKYPNTVVKGQDLFDISLFRDEITLQVFCTFMESLYSSSIAAKPTETHKFIKILKDKNKLLRCYTQNIDGIERQIDLTTGVNLNEFSLKGSFAKTWKSLDVVQLHGDLNKLSCTQCFTNFQWNSKYQDMLSNGSNPECVNCHRKYEERLYQGKRLTGNIGMLRPGIVLYGENHPQAEILAQGLNTDIRSRPDLLIIMGTSLKVDGVKKLVKSLATAVHDKGGKVIFVNKTNVSSSQWDNYIDYQVLSDCDNFIKVLKQEVPDLFLTQEQLDSQRLRKLEEKKIKVEEKRIKVEQRQKIKLEKELEREIKKEGQKEGPKIKKEGQTQDIPSIKLEPIDGLTPPSTPSKKRKRPVLERRNLNSTKKLKMLEELPSPPTSFTSDVVVTHQLHI